MVAVVPAAAAAVAPGAGSSRSRAPKKASNPSPSPRRRDSPSSARPPLSSSEKDNAAAPNLPRAKEITSRYLSPSSRSSSFSSAAKGGAFSASSSSSSKGASFTSSSCSTSTASSSSSSSTATSSQRRPRSPLPPPRPSTPPAFPQTCVPSRSKSADRTRLPDTAPRRAAHDSPELSTAARVLRTTTRSLSVSFQGESFSYQTSKARPASPSPNRKPTPDRRGPSTPSVTTARNSFKSESSRPFDSHHRWPAARTQQFNALTRSFDCSLPENNSMLAAIQSLRQSMVSDDGARRASFDGGDFSLSFDTDCSSSGGNSESHESSTLPPRGRAVPRGRDVPARFLQEKGSRLRRFQQCTSQLSPAPNTSKPIPAKKSLMNGLLLSPFVASPHQGSARPSSPSRPTATSPRGISVQVLSSCPLPSSTISLPGNVAPSFSFATEIRRGKIGERRIDDAHHLRLLHNRHLQWRWVNAQVNGTFIAQSLTAEKYLYSAWLTTTEMHQSVATKKLKLQTDRQHLKLNYILKGEMAILEEWSLVDQEHSNALSGAIEALKASTIRLPVVDRAKADFQDVRNAVGSAVDVMQAIGTSVCAVLSKIEGRSSMVSELAELATKEQALMDQCRDLLSMLAALHVKQCSLLGHITQQRRPSLIQL